MRRTCHTLVDLIFGCQADERRLAMDLPPGPEAVFEDSAKKPAKWLDFSIFKSVCGTCSGRLFILTVWCFCVIFRSKTIKPFQFLSSFEKALEI
jgi:hypothetical protein